MDKYNELLIEYMKQLLYNHQVIEMNVNDFPEEQRKIAESILFLGQCTLENFYLAKAITSGELDSVVSNSNPLVGPLKDLQATLRHLTWQTKQVAGGDYGQRIEFLGDLSSAFNTMVEQLKNREELIRENAKKDKEITDALTQMLEKELNSQVEHYEKMNHVNNEIISYRHDMKNHFFCIESFLNSGKIEDAKNYIQSISNVINQKSSVLNTRNYVFDALVSEKIRSAKEMNITINTSIAVEPNLNITPVDWCILFGNALDNAIEACEQVDEGKVIDLLVKNKNDFLITEIRNPFNSPRIRDGKLFRTLKEDSDNHGKGLKNIEEVVGKYDGSMEIKCDDNEFVLTFMLCDIAPVYNSEF